MLLPDVDLDWARLPRAERARAGPARAARARPARGSASTRSRPPTWCWCPALAVSADRRCGSGRAAAATTAPWPGSRSAPSPACCSTTTRSASTCPPSRTTGRVTAVVTPAGLHASTSAVREPAERVSRRRSSAVSRSGGSVSVSLGRASTASRVNAHGQRLAVDPELGLVGVVGVRVARDPGEVDPARVVEVGERDDHPHRRRAVDLVALGGVPPVASTIAPPPPTSPAAAVEQPLDRRRCRTRRASGCAGRAGAGGPTSTRRGSRAWQRVSSSRASSIACAQDVVAGLDDVVGVDVVPPRVASGRRAGRLTTANQRSPPSGHDVLGQLVVEGQREQVAPDALKYAAGARCRRAA